MAIPDNYIDKITKDNDSRMISPAADMVRVNNDNFDGETLDDVLDDVAQAISEAGEVKSVTINGTNHTPNSSGVVDLGTIQGEKGDKGDTGNVTVTDGVAQITIVNDLTTGGTGDSLSAEMGKEIKRNYLNALDEITIPESVETTAVTSFTSGRHYVTYNVNVGGTFTGNTGNQSGARIAKVPFVAGDVLRVWGKGTGVANVWVLVDANNVVKAKSNTSSGGGAIAPSGSITEANPDVLTPDYNGTLYFTSVNSVSFGVTVAHTTPAHLIVADDGNNGLMSKELAAALDESFFNLVDDIKQTPYTEDINVEVLYNQSNYSCFQTAAIGTEWNPSRTSATDKKCTKHSIKAGDVIDIWGQGTGPAALYVITDEDNIVRARGYGGQGTAVSTVFTEEDPLTITSQWSGTLYMNCVRTVSFGATIHRVHSGAKRATSEQDGLMTKEQVSVMDELTAALATQSGGLAQKLIAVIGDSFSAPGAWQRRMNQILGSSTANAAKSGGRWASTDPSTDAYNQALGLVSGYANAERKPDYILCVLGVNDVNNAVTLGDIVYSDTIGTGSGEIDYSTFTGGIQAVLTVLKNNFPNAIIKVGFTPAGMMYLAANSTITERTETYLQRLQYVANLYGVGYLETRACGICRIVTQEYNMFKSNDAHPGTDGQNRIGEYMARLMLSNL